MKKIITFVLCLSMTIGVLSGCVQEKPIESKRPIESVEPVETMEPVESTSPVESTEPTETIEPVETTEPTEVTDPFEPTESTLKGNTFDEKLVNYINEQELGKDNYVMSPMSFKMALSLLVEGAEGETLEELLNVLGVETVESIRGICLYPFLVSKRIDDKYTEYLTLNPYLKDRESEEYKEKAPKLMISNSVWKNNSDLGEIVEDYKKAIKRYYEGTTETLDADKMKETINQWASDKTNGMIPGIVDDSVANMSTVLVNAIYIKDGWLDSFSKSMTEKGTFKAIDGSETEKEYMQNTDSYRYYEDDETKLVVIPTTYGFEVVYVIGSRDNIEEKLTKAEYEEVHVRIPKLDLESSLDNGILVDFLKEAGVKKSFTSDADFSKMCTTPINVSDIIQKAKIKTDEDGIEGAAVTAIVMEKTCVSIDPTEPKEFNANEPFSFYVKLKDVSSELKEQDSTIFYGQVVR